jgi:hypothetical protein
MIRDTELIKDILIKDFQHFTDHGIKVIKKKTIYKVFILCME